MNEAWFSALGEPLDEAEMAELAAYEKRAPRSGGSRLAGVEFGAARRLARAAGAESDHPFLRKYALYSGGRWPLGVYDGAFAIF